MVAGHILNYAFSQDENNWNHMSSFVIDYLHREKNLLLGKDLVER